MGMWPADGTMWPGDQNFSVMQFLPPGKFFLVHTIMHAWSFFFKTGIRLLLSKKLHSAISTQGPTEQALKVIPADTPASPYLRLFRLGNATVNNERK